MSGFVESLVRFGSAFDGSGFRAVGPLRHEIGGEGAEQIGPACVEGLAIGVAEETGPLLKGVDGAFEGELVNRAVMLTGTLEHDTTNQVVGDGLHVDFLEHELGRLGPQDVESQGGLNVAEVQFDLPAAAVQLDDGLIGILFCIKQGGGQNHIFGPKTGFAHAVAHDAHCKGLGQRAPQRGRPVGTALGFGPVFEAGLGFLARTESDHDVELLLHQAGEEGPAAEATIGHDDFAGQQPGEQLTGQAGVMHLPVAEHEVREMTGGQTEQADQFASGEPTAGQLTCGVVELASVFLCIRHGHTGAVQNSHGTAQPQIRSLGLGFKPGTESFKGFCDQSKIESTPRLTVGAGAIIRSDLTPGQKPRLHPAHRFTATAAPVHHLPQKRRKGHHRREEPVALACCRFEQLRRNKTRNQRGQSIDTRSFCHHLYGLRLSPARTHQIGKAWKIHRLGLHGLT